MSSAKSDAVDGLTLAAAGRDIPLVVRRYARARGYRLRYDASKGELRLSLPARGSMKPALDWARTQTEWIARQVGRVPDRVLIGPGAILPVEGVECTVLWDRKRPRLPLLEDCSLLVGGPEDSVGPRVLRWLRRHALDVLRRETLEIAMREGLCVASVAIGDPRSRWGSCSAQGAIRYSWRLILAPPDVRRSTVAHEVAHLLHMDHSPAFHAAHRRLLGADPRPAREWLRRHGAGLHRFTV